MPSQRTRFHDYSSDTEYIPQTQTGKGTPESSSRIPSPTAPMAPSTRRMVRTAAKAKDNKLASQNSGQSQGQKQGIDQQAQQQEQEKLNGNNRTGTAILQAIAAMKEDLQATKDEMLYIKQSIETSIATTVTQTVTQTITQMITQGIAQAVAQAVPQAVTQAVKEAVASTVAQAVAEAVPIAVTQTIPEAVTQAVTQALSQASTQTKSYASVAAPSQHLLSPSIAITPPNSSPTLRSISNPSPSATSRTAARAKHQLAVIELNLKDTSCNTENPKELKDLMGTAIQANQKTQNATCKGVILGQKDTTRFVFSNEAEAQTVRTEQPWTTVAEKDFKKARIVQREIFKVKASRVNKLSVGNPGKGEKIDPTIVQDIAADNNVRIQGMRMLSQPSDSQWIQLVVICSTAEDKERLLDLGLITIQGEVATTSEFYESQPIRQCFKCWGFNHNAKDCINQETCPTCGERGHQDKSCPKTINCCNCKGDHTATDPSCPHRRRMTREPYGQYE